MTTNVNFQINGKDFDELFVRSDIFSEGGLWGWGLNSSGQLGNNTITDVSSPVQTVAGGTNWKLVSSGFSGYTTAIKTDGTLWLWGINTNGQLGTGNRTSRSSPVQTIAGGNNWKLVSAGDEHTGAIKTDGTLWLWGSNIFVQLGDNTTASKSSPVQIFGGGTNWKLVSCGTYHSVAIKTDGTAWAWGTNSSGQLGDNTVSPKSSPVQTISTGTNWKTISAGGFYSMAIKTDGTLWSWGQNSYGQLGDNTITNRSSPVQTISAGTNWKQVSCGLNHTAAIKTDGTLWLWGRNLYGGLGDNTTQSRSSPVQTIVGGTNWKQVSLGNFTTSAIKTDGTLWSWGYNPFGQLGDGTTTDRSSPVQIITGGTNWKLVSVGDFHMTTVITDYWI